MVSSIFKSRSKEELARRAEQAGLILSNPLYIEVFNDLQKMYLTLGTQNAMCPDKRKMASDMVFALDALQNHLQRALDGEKIEALYKQLEGGRYV